jgi:pimeloyl-ACP methyl ester carboxylesterase
MTRWRFVLAALGAAILIFAAWATRDMAMPRRTTIIEAGGCRLPVTIIEPEDSPAGGAVIAIHGLAANRRLMQTIGDDLAFDASLRVYLVDLPGHGDNIEAFSFARAQHCASALAKQLIDSGEIDPDKTAFLGHSMGGDIAIAMADSEPVAATIAISPGPLVLPRRMPTNLLIFSARYDLRLLKNQARELQRAAGGDRTDSADFLERRAFLLQKVSAADHSSLLFDQRVFDDTRDWIENSFQAAANNTDGVFSWNARSSWNQEQTSPGVRTQLRAVLQFLERSSPLLGLCGLAMLFPLAIQWVTRYAAISRGEEPLASPSWLLVLIEVGVAGLAAVLLLAFVVPLKFIRLYSGDYLASLGLVVALFLIALNSNAARKVLSFHMPAILAAAILGFAAILSFGAWLNWQMDDAWLNVPRWLRFAALLPFTWLFCFSEEAVLGPVTRGKSRALRYLVSLIMRLELWLACLVAVFFLSNGRVLIILLVVPLALISLLGRLAGDAIRLRTGSATGASLFGAILVSWLFAALFPLI